MKRPSFEKMCMNVAEAISQRSTCNRRRVGAVLVSEDYHRIYSWGYNGGVRKQKTSCNKTEGACGCVHAEQNLLHRLSAFDGLKKYLFTTTAPCENCAKYIANCGFIDKVFYKEAYRSSEGLKVLKRSKIPFKRIK